MKKFLIALSLGLVMFGSVSYAAVPSEPTKIGIIKRITGGDQSLPTRVYMLVRYASKDGGTTLSNSPTLPSGSAVIWDLNSDDGVTIKTTTTSADPAFAGITVADILSADVVATTGASDDNGKRNWGYMQVFGPIAGAKVVAGGTNANAAGAVFVTSRDEGAITGVEVPTVNPTVGSFNQYQAVANGRGGIFLNAGDGTSTSILVYIKNE